MATVDNELESKDLIEKLISPQQFPKNEKLKINNYKTPMDNRKIVPSISTKIPEYAWNVDRDIENNIINENVDTSSKNEEDTDSLYISTSDLDLLSHNSHLCKDNALEIYKCVPKLKTDNEMYKHNHQYKPLPLSNSILLPHTINDQDGLRKNVKKKLKKNRKIYIIHKYFPYFIALISLIEIGVYIWGDDKVVKTMMYSPHERHQVWRFISYMLLHSEWIHLSLNITIQTLLAVFLELEQKWWRCAIIYLGGGISGAMGTSVLQPSLYMVGASAGVYALLISHIANVAVRFSSINYKNFRIFAVFTLAGFDVTYTIYHSFTNYNSQPKIGWAAHCAGAIAGIALGLLIYDGGDKGNVYIKIATAVVSIVFLIYIIGSIVFNIYFSVIS